MEDLWLERSMALKRSPAQHSEMQHEALTSESAALMQSVLYTVPLEEAPRVQNKKKSQSSHVIDRSYHFLFVFALRCFYMRANYIVLSHLFLSSSLL